MNKNFNKIIGGVLLVCSVLNAQQKSVNKKPNVVIVLADDIGVGDISHYRKMHKGKIILETPNIDKLANQGATFTNAHAPAALCATSRYSIMTGNNNYRSPKPWGVWSGYAPTEITKEQVSLGRVMKAADYNTAFFGKWHMGTSFAKKSNPNEIYELQHKSNINVDITKIIEGGPKSHQFDYSFTLPSGIQNEPYAAYENGKWFPLKKNSEIAFIDKIFMNRIGGEMEKKPGLGDSNWNPSAIGPLLANKAVKFISQKAKEDKPFFMYYCSQAVHTPHMAAAELDGVKIAGTTPSRHIDMIKELDVQVGMLVKELKKQGVYDNTVFIFTSDNGGLHIDSDSWNVGHEPSDIYRGKKNDPYEGGHRVPFLAIWPNHIKAKSTVNNLTLGTDILATIAAVAEYKIPEKEALDSYNLIPVLTGKEKKHTRPNVLVQGGSGREAVIVEGDWKLIIQFDKKDKTNKTRTPVALFNLKTNPTEDEQENLIAVKKYQRRVTSLFKKYNQTRDSKVYTGKHF
ncbi:arylsulfatase A-like enzyme [Wenyingzhuangia heitensis]|uniref:Arylsulfatase A-like enzyme n=1 Tax=Wenyingzhuangia heitensis TaxID=1487859 RepID=A0ABX0UEF5_9FLAO|nr:arylsulfatase [Wenyingzhuangia heitensis]NIJ45906.1 arylsulfatase A-like enzyme [Wenyingzhuangia heitensis]